MQIFSYAHVSPLPQKLPGVILARSSVCPSHEVLEEGLSWDAAIAGEFLSHNHIEKHHLLSTQ